MYHKGLKSDTICVTPNTPKPKTASVTTITTILTGHERMNLEKYCWKKILPKLFWLKELGFQFLDLGLEQAHTLRWEMRFSSRARQLRNRSCELAFLPCECFQLTYATKNVAAKM